MVLIAVLCPYCHGDRVRKRGKTDTGKQRYRCQNPECTQQSVLLAPAYRGCLPKVKRQILEMSLHGSGVRDTARVLQISPTTVIHELKKGSALAAVNTPLLETLRPDDVGVRVNRVEAAEVDEMGSVVGKKQEPRWLWHAIDHGTGRVLAYVLWPTQR